MLHDDTTEPKQSEFVKKKHCCPQGSFKARAWTCKLLHWTIALGLISLAWVGLPTSANPLPDDLQFTQILSDPQDSVGFYDIRSVDLAEPGNGTLVIRFTLEDPTVFGPNVDYTSRVSLFWQSPNSSVIGLHPDSTPYSSNDSNATVLACWIDGFAYCIVDYGFAGLSVGDTLAEATAESVGGVRGSLLDHAPGIGPVPDMTGPLEFAFGEPYLITGCSRSSGCPVALNLTATPAENGSNLTTNSTLTTSTSTAVAPKKDAPLPSLAAVAAILTVLVRRRLTL